MPIHPDLVALGTVQWVNIRQDPSMPPGVGGWELNNPGFRDKLPGILADVRASGFDAVPMGVLPQHTIQKHEALMQEYGLRQAPGYVQVTLPEDDGLTLKPGDPDWIRRLDAVRRISETSNYFGLDVAYLSADMRRNGRPRTMEKAAVGHAFDQGRLERETELLADATETMRQEGIKAAFHNHVGTWVETRSEIEFVLDNIPDLGVGFDTGHMAWAGIDPIEMIGKYADRILGLHLKDVDEVLAAASRATPGPYYEGIDATIQREPGLGTLDLVGILTALPSSFDGWIIVEVDQPTMPVLDSAKHSFRWVEEVYRPLAISLQEGVTA